jgi:hypothetical protein
MTIKLAALAALLLPPGQAMAEDLRVDCVTDQRIVCRDDETTCREPVRETGWYHFTFDLTKKTGSLVFCSSDSSCMAPSPLTVVHDYCAFLHDFGAVPQPGGHLCVGAEPAANIHNIQLAIRHDPSWRHPL